MGLKLSPSRAQMHLETGRNIEDIRGDTLCVSAPNKRSRRKERIAYGPLELLLYWFSFLCNLSKCLVICQNHYLGKCTKYIVSFERIE